MHADAIGGPRCPLTGRTVAEELQHAVYALASVAVHERDGVRYNDAEYRAYCDGYYRALQIAGAAIDLQLEKRRIRLNGRRADASIRPQHPRRAPDGARRRTRRREQPAPALAGEPSRVSHRGPRDRSRER